MAEPILSQVHNRSLHFIRTAREYSRIHFLFQGTVGYQGGAAKLSLHHKPLIQVRDDMNTWAGMRCPSNLRLMIVRISSRN